MKNLWLHRRRSRGQKTDTLPMTPMIDVVFLLLIYFIFTFETPDRLAGLPVLRPTRHAHENMRVTPSFMIGVYQNIYTINDTQVSVEAMTRVFHNLAKIDPTTNVVVIATGNSPHRALISLMDLLHKSGLETITLLSAD